MCKVMVRGMCKLHILVAQVTYAVIQQLLPFQIACKANITNLCIVLFCNMLLC